MGFEPVKCPEDCWYRQTVNGNTPMCGYLFMTGQMRGCDPGPECRRYISTNPRFRERRHRGPTWDVEKGRRMWEAGCTDGQIAKELGVRRETVWEYRRRNWGEVNRERQKRK